ncbi:MAG: glycerol acyltransferase, partial [Micromonosporaceae bacterium]|nr:glycerol acyltransferase [Micromonosporaceae bacterium]
MTRPRKAAAAADGQAVRRRRPAATTRRASGADPSDADGHRTRSAATATVPTMTAASLEGTAVSTDASVAGAARANGRRPGPAGQPAGGAGAAAPDDWEERVADLLAFLRRRLTGRYEVDEFGFDPELTETVFYPLLRLLYRHYFRVEV